MKPEILKTMLEKVTRFKENIEIQTVLGNGTLGGGKPEIVALHARTKCVHENSQVKNSRSIVKT